PAEVAALEEKYGKLPATVTAVSGSRRPGAKHRFFAWDDRLSSDLGCRPGVDVLAGGKKLVILAPSFHASGNHYAFIKGLTPHEIQPARAPEWMIKVILDASAQSLANTRNRELARQHRDWIDAGPGAGRFAAAALAYNRDHRGAWSKRNGSCPVCTSPTGFRESRPSTETSAAWWVCFSDRHKLLVPACGLQNSDGSFSGTQLDLDAHGRGITTRQLLVTQGYLLP
ncbi:MAG: bifunctional DNA primase/polymerase, partial [Armatimonadota bacterium]